MARQRPDEALHAANDAVEILVRLDDKLAEAKAKQLLANAHVAQGTHTEALKAANDALTIVRKANDKNGEAELLNTIAQAHMARYNHIVEDIQNQSQYRHMPMDDPQRAAQAARMARTLFRQVGNELGELNTMDTLTRATLAKQDTREAVHLSEECVRLADKVGDQLAQGNAYLLAAGMYGAAQRRTPALKAGQEAYKIFKQIDSEDGIWLAEQTLQAARALEDKAIQDVQADRQRGRLHSGFGGNGGGSRGERFSPQMDGRKRQIEERKERERGASNIFQRKAFP